jgi:hypothetical protein
MVESKLKEVGQQPNAAADDATFLRRTYLHLTGRIPSPQEAERFLKSADPQRRAKLIDGLVGSEGYVSTMFNHWADALRAKSDLDHGRSGDLYLWWIKDAVRQNVPYDRFVRKLLLAKGSLWDDPAVSFHFRDAGNKLAWSRRPRRCSWARTSAAPSATTTRSTSGPAGTTGSSSRSSRPRRSTSRGSRRSPTSSGTRSRSSGTSCGRKTPASGWAGTPRR